MNRVHADDRLFEQGGDHRAASRRARAWRIRRRTASDGSRRCRSRPRTMGMGINEQAQRRPPVSKAIRCCLAIGPAEIHARGRSNRPARGYRRFPWRARRRPSRARADHRHNPRRPAAAHPRSGREIRCKARRSATCGRPSTASSPSIQVRQQTQLDEQRAASQSQRCSGARATTGGARRGKADARYRHSVRRQRGLQQQPGERCRRPSRSRVIQRSSVRKLGHGPSSRYGFRLAARLRSHKIIHCSIKILDGVQLWG